MNVANPSLEYRTRPSEDLLSGASNEDNIPPIRRYIRIALRWRYVMIGSVVGCLLLGLVVTLLMKPKYTASSTIEISRESERVTKFQGVDREASEADQEFYQTQYGLLKSRSLSERVAQQLRLVNDPKFFEMFGVSSDEDGAFAQAGGRYTVQGRTARLRIAGEVLRRNFAVTPAQLSRLVEIRFTSRSPDFSAKIANAYAENFIQTNLERKIQATSYGRDLLQRQLAQAKERLDESQRQLVRYASAQRIINLPGQPTAQGGTSERSLVADELQSLNAVLTQATADRIQAEALYREQGRAGASGDALRNQAINALRQRRAELASDYQRMMVQFEPGYAPARAIKAQIDQLDKSVSREEARVTGSAEAAYRQASRREAELSARVEALKSSFLDLRTRSIRYNIFQQEVDTNRALYDALLQRYKEIGVAGGVGINNVIVVDPAVVPDSPSSPRIFLNLALALLVGIGLGSILAFALEQLDEAITDPSEVERLLGLPLLGTVPKIVNAEPREALLDRKSALVEAYLAIQTSLAFATEHGVPRSLAVTSTRPAEGKSTTALALATMLARAGQRVVLVDGDMRSPSVHMLAGVGHEIGLSNYLTGYDNLNSIIFPVDDLGLSIITAGPLPPNAAELLTGNRLSILVERLLESFDNVIIDSPPVMGLADAPLIASRVEGVIYAVESHQIRSSQVKAAIARLRGSHARIFGSVLTKFESKKASYGYGYEYGYSYGREDK
ncbi:GumC family protein [Sphingomonas faeni]|uniref:GumC family protein n=1 Tax=Sphingomonas faeni TaxID=185950 RepID=UPI002787564C|nr:polysaccharide biosynthesis tyrosine autokinase [Sphingomonas faeni]MDQ0839846.1 succinoglycan biosynthesis transport protein ExoP [Sphingomonas faeni]